MNAQSPGPESSAQWPQSGGPYGPPTQPMATPTSPAAPSAPAAPPPPYAPYGYAPPSGPYLYDGHPAYFYGPPQPAQPKTVWWRSTAAKCLAGAAALVLVGGVAFAAGTTQGHTNVVEVPAASSGSGSGQGSSQGSGDGSSQGQDPFGQFGFGPGWNPGQSPDGSGDQGSGSDGTLPTATTAQQAGVVLINTTLRYQQGEAAGTGMVLDSNGDILTNNHVVEGSTSIKVTVASTGKTYSATVVGTVPTQDIAVIHLANASGLQTANFGDSDSVKVGDQVTGVGNAGGTGTVTAAAGHVLALNQSITASDGDGSNSEQLPNVIVSDAPIQPGDSGGPLYNAKDQVVGIDTAANDSGSSTTTAGFAIPIDKARSLAGRILDGDQTSEIHQGYPGFLGVSIGSDQGDSGALVDGALDGGPAAQAGIGSGDAITRVGSTDTPNAAALQKAMAGRKPGDKLTVTYVDQSGQSRTTTVTLVAGPAD